MCSQIKIGVPVDPGVLVILVCQSSPYPLSRQQVHHLPFDLWVQPGPSKQTKQQQ